MAIAALFEHNRWANLAFLEACRAATQAQLAFVAPGTYGSSAETLVHLLSGEQRYVERLTGDARANALREVNGWPGIDALVEHASWSGDALIRFAQSLAGDPPFPTSWQGRNYLMRPSVMLVQAINHATEHRTHVSTALTAQGTAMPELDAWTWGEATRAYYPTD